MHLDAWTLLMQAVNLLVLGLVMWWFLYRPIQATIDRRAAEDQQVRDEAIVARTSAERRAAELDARLQALDAVSAERMRQDAERAATMVKEAIGQAEAEVLSIRARGLQDLEKERKSAQADLNREAGRLAQAVALRLLAPVASAIIHRQLVDNLVAALLHLPASSATATAAQIAAGGSATLRTSHPLPADLLASLSAAIARTIGPLPALACEETATLICGVELHLPGLTMAHHWQQQIQRTLSEVDHG